MPMDKPTSDVQWRWVVLAASFFSLLLTGFGQYHTGVMKVVLLHHWGNDGTAITWLTSYYAGAFALWAPVGSLVINMVNCRACVLLSGVLCLVGFVLSSLVTDVRYLFITISLIGIGQAMSNAGSFVILGYYFSEQTSIASGVMMAGGALGIFLHPPLLQALVTDYGLQGALLISGAIALQGSVCGALMRPSRLERKTTVSKRQGNVAQGVCHFITDLCSDHVTAVTSWSMLTFLLSVLIMSLAYHSLLVMLPYHLIHHRDLTATQASFSTSMMGIGSFFSRLTSGFIAHDSKAGSLLIFCGLVGVESLVSLAAPSLLSEGLAGSYAYCLLVGLYTGGSFALIYPVVYDLVGVHHSSTGFGLAYFALGVGGLLGAPLTELVYSIGQSDYFLFGFIAFLFCVAAVLGSLVTTLDSRTIARNEPLSVTPLSSSGILQQEGQKEREQEILLTQLNGEQCIVLEHETRAAQTLKEKGSISVQELLPLYENEDQDNFSEKNKMVIFANVKECKSSEKENLLTTTDTENKMDPEQNLEYTHFKGQIKSNASDLGVKKSVIINTENP